MNSLYRWITLSSIAAALVLVATASPAFTDANAELKEARADRSARVVVLVKAAPPKPALYVPLATAKQLDSFKPVPPSDRSIAGTRLAKADAAK
ncbi:hypothetical protein [Roseateles sp. P5_E7]